MATFIPRVAITSLQSQMLDLRTVDEMKQQNLLKQAQLTGLAFLIIGSVTLIGCTPSTDAPDTPISQTEPTSTVPVPPAAAPTGDAELPAAVEASVLQDIATTNNVPAEELEVTAARPEAWPDGCLGLGGPDEICTFAIVDGWEVTVTQGEEQWIYRTDSDGSVVRNAAAS